jgi:hypothetical protein
VPSRIIVGAVEPECSNLEEEHFVPEPRVKENGDARSDETIYTPELCGLAVGGLRKYPACVAL